MTDARPHDPFAPARPVARRPRRSTAQETLPDWLIDALRDRDVTDESIELVQRQFADLTPAERAQTLADMTSQRPSPADLDDLAAALIEYQSDAGDAGDAVTGGDGGDGAGDAVTSTSGDQGGPGDDPGHTPDRVTEIRESIAERDAETPDAPLPTNDDGSVDTEVPRNANDVVSWIGDAPDQDELRGRAQKALDVELGYPSVRKTVRQALDLALGEAHVQTAIDAKSSGEGG